MEQLSTESVYNVGFDIWNKLMEIAITMFTTSPSAASGDVYSIIKTLYDSIRSISVPLCTVFFLIAIIKDVLATDPQQASRKLAYQTIKYAVFLGMLANLWEIMGGLMAVADGITDAMGSASAVEMTASSDLTTLITEVNALAPVTVHSQDFTIMGAGTWLKESLQIFEEKTQIMMFKGAFFISGIVFVGTIIACCLSILSAAFQRILKPLVIMPFSAITVALAAGTPEAERVATSYLKTFFGFCLSGAFMVVCVNIGTAMSNGGLIVFDITDMDLTSRMIYICLQNVITPIVIAGLVKSVDSIIGRFL